MPRSRRSTIPSPAGPEELGSQEQWLTDSLSHVKELSDRVTELSTLMGVSTLLSSDHPLSEALETVCRLSAEICKAQVSFVHLVDGEDDLVCVARHTPNDTARFAWEGIARIYGRKSIQKGEIVACPRLLQQGNEEPEDSRIGGVCAVPLMGKSRAVGSIAVGHTSNHRYSAREKDMLNAIAAQVAMAVERSWLFDQLQEQLARSNSLREVATRIGSNLELDQVLDSIVNHASRLLAAEFSSICLIDQAAVASSADAGSERDHAHGSGPAPEKGFMDSAIQQAVETGKPAIVQRPSSQSSADGSGEIKASDYRVALAVPLLSRQEVLGALVTCYLEHRRFDPSDISLAEAFARQAALAIRNARLYEDAMENRLSLETAINQINNHGISVMDEALNIRFANPAAFWLIGVKPRKGKISLEQWIERAKRVVADDAQLDQFAEQIQADPERTVMVELQARRSADMARTLRLCSFPLRQGDGSLKGRVNVLEEVN